MNASLVRSPHRRNYGPKEVEEFLVMKQYDQRALEGTRYRYRVSGQDFSLEYLRSLECFKLKFSSNMSATDIARVAETWKDKLIDAQQQSFC
jgi:hypothetical protein